MHKRGFAACSYQELEMHCQLPSVCRSQVAGRNQGFQPGASTLGAAHLLTHHCTALPGSWDRSWLEVVQ